MNKNDLIVIISILLLAAAAYIGISTYRRHATADNPQVVVTVDGEEYGRYPLSEDLQTEIRFEDGSFNRLVIENGKAKISEASCPDQICVNHFRIQYSGETIVCLPNKVVVEIVGGLKSDVDGSVF